MLRAVTLVAVVVAAAVLSSFPDLRVPRYLETAEARIIGKGREVVGRRRDGGVFPLRLSVGEMSVAGRRKFTGMLHDLSTRADLDARPRASEARWRSIVQSAVASAAPFR